MSTPIASRPPTWFWLVAALALGWNLLGVVAYLAEAYGLGREMQQPEAASLDVARPAWATAAYAVAVFSGALGCVGLLLRRRWARALLMVSLAALLIQQGWAFLVSDALALLGPGAAVFPALVVLVSIGLVWLAALAVERGWLR